MSTNPKLPLSSRVINIQQFWTWLQAHPNCILSAGTPEAVLYDDDDYHWHLGSEGDDLLLVQVVRGKQVVGEIGIMPRRVAYVQTEAKDEEEFVFECIEETAEDRIAAWQFTMAHDYDAEEPVKGGRWVH